jgi:nucleoside-diphosphate-sugar epimerase
MCLTEKDATTFVRVFDGIVDRAVVISSADVYRNYGRMHKTEPGPPDPLPLHEDSPLREKLSEQGEHYNKTGVERIVNRATFPVTVLRYPAIYGPGDPLNRTYDKLKRIDDGRRFIILEEAVAGWRFHECYCENAGYALTLAIMNDKAARRTYNVGDPNVPTWKERAERIAGAVGWTGQIVVLPNDRLPESMVFPGDLSASLVLDTSRIRKELGFSEVVSYDDGLARTIEWQRATPPKEGGPLETDYAVEDQVLRTAGLL